jgi:hypothetical protein
MIRYITLFVIPGMMMNPSGFAQLPPAALRVWNEKTVPYQVDKVLSAYGTSGASANQFTKRVQAHAETAKQFMLQSGVSPLWDDLQLKYAEEDQGRNAELLNPDVRNATHGIEFFVQEFHSKKGVSLKKKRKMREEEIEMVVITCFLCLQ